MKINLSKDKVQKSEFEQKLEESQTDAGKGTPPDDHTDAETTPQDDHERTIPVVEEQVRVGKKVVETSKVHITKDVHEELKDLDIPLMHEEVEVERVAINMHVDSPPPPVRYEGEKMIIPVLKEEVVVQKRLVLVEELHVTRKQVQTHEKKQVTLRKEEVHVKRDNSPEDNSKQPR